MTLQPTNPIEDAAALTPEAAEALFSAAATPLPGEVERRLAVLDSQGGIVYAAAAALEMFEAKTLAELQNQLMAGEGPNARRLRRLAATLPVGEPARLERMRFSLGRRSLAVNLRCARVEATGGASFLVLSTAVIAGGADSSSRAEDPGASPPPNAPAQGQTPHRSRFLWTVDEHARFGPEDPLLTSTLGSNAPREGETIEQLRLRSDIVNGAEFARVLDKRETFSDLLVVWPLADRAIEVVLSGAPTFDRRRNFAGYRGFGVLGETVSLPSPGRSGVVAPEQQAAESPPSAPALAETEPSPIPSGVGADLEAPTTTEPRVAQTAADETRAALAEEGAAEEAADEATEAATPITNEVVAAQGEAGATASPTLEEADGSESIPALPESAEAEQSNAPGARPPEAASGDEVVGGVVGFGHGASHERTAEIYVLRQTAAPSSPSKIVPIRPGALEAAAPADPAQGAGDGSVELTKSERDAFREIARALVGRTPAPREDRVSDAGPVAEAPHEPEEALGPRPVRNEPLGSAPDDVDPVRRNAGGILDRLPVGVLVARDARALYLNHSLLALLGYSDFEHFRTADGFAAMFRGRDPHAIPPEGGGALSIVRADGQSLAVDGHAQAIVWDGAPATLIALRRSPEAEKKEKSRESERDSRTRNGAANELQEMLDHATDGAVTLDSAGRILGLNQSAERLFGYEQRETAGESVLMLLAPQSHPETTAKLESLSRVSESAFGAPFSVVGRRRNGTTLALGLTLGRIGPPEASHYCALVRDLAHERETERRFETARDAALAASSAKTDFLAQVSHEIRTPLHAILGFSEVMMEERFGPIGNERYKDYLKDIHASAKHVMSLADDLLDLSKIESGKLELAFAPVDANSVIRECVSLMQPQAARERIIMRVSLLEHLPRVMVDERSLRQIMLNLMSNAVKFNEPGGQVIVSTAVDAAGQAVIRVRDTGVGMNENEIGLALEPFGQLGRQDRKGGAGLGLPLTKALVEANKAEFSIKSRREQGTLIEIAFPTIQAAQ